MDVKKFGTAVCPTKVKYLKKYQLRILLSLNIFSSEIDDVLKEELKQITVNIFGGLVYIIVNL